MSSCFGCAQVGVVLTARLSEAVLVRRFDDSLPASTSPVAPLRSDHLVHKPPLQRA